MINLLLELVGNTKEIEKSDGSDRQRFEK